VDNNSTDGTREVVESFIRDYPELRYIFVGNQGVANARNAGIREARGRILAFMDDDVRASPNWLAEIKLAFDKHPEAGFVGGKILPVWPVPPPAWLTSEHWSPLAILDYGDSEICLVPENTIGVVSANLAIRREVFQQVGLFSPEFQLVGNGIGAIEDHELIVRIWRGGGRGIYLPQAIVTTDVPLVRMTKRYHRRWQRGHGRFYALLREPEMERSAAHLFGVPSHVFKQALLDIVLSLKYSLTLNASKALLHQERIYFFLGYVRQRTRDFQATRQHTLWSEIAGYISKLLNRTSRRLLI
jgi:GT2 family glycosyltransferase